MTYYQTTAVYFRKLTDNISRVNYYNYSQYKLPQSFLLNHRPAMTETSSYLWALQCYRDSQGNTLYTLAEKNKPTQIYYQLPNKWVLEMLAAEPAVTS